MNIRARLLTSSFLMVMLLMLVISSANAGASKTYFNGSETPTAVILPGVETFPDGRYHLRGEVDTFAFTADDPRLDNAENRVTINWNFKWMPEPVFVSGQMWGTFILSNAGGYWEGNWTGLRDENGYSYFHFVGSGFGGYQGMQLRMWGERLDPDPTVPEICQGYILEPAR